MQVGTSLFYDRGAAQLSALSTRADTLNTQIATQKKTSAPSQDVVSYSRLAGIRRATADETAYGTNRALAQSLVQQGDTTLSAVTAQLQRAQELTVQAANGTLDDVNRRAIATELQGIRDDLVALANTVDVRGQPLFGTATGTTAVTQAADGSVSFDGTGTPATLPVGDGATVQPTETAARIFGAPAGGSDVFTVLGDYIAALNAGGPATTASGTAGTALKAAVTQVTDVQGSIGARAARLDLLDAQASDAADVRELDRSGLEDTDLSSAIAELQKTMTILQAAQASFTKLGQLSLFDYLR